MAKWNLKSLRVPSGGLTAHHRKKRRMDRGSEFIQTRVGKRKSSVEKTRGGSQITKLLSEEKVNISDKGKTFTSKIISVVENPANPHFVRRNIITKGAVIKTEAGLARVTSRPGRQGIVNAVLVQDKKAK